jgi:protein-serine/threonine kinase
LRSLTRDSSTVLYSVTDRWNHTNRRHELEQKLIADTSIPDKEKKNQILALGRTESSFLRLRRTRLGLQDFKTVKVIGKGAFGEVGLIYSRLRVIQSVLACTCCS